MPADIGRQRAVRRDAVENREKILRTAAEVFARAGHHVPLTEIAEAAGVGVGTLYRSFQDRTALLIELQRRGLDLLVESLTRIRADGHTGADAIELYLTECLELADQLVALPARGGDPLTDDASIALKSRIDVAISDLLAEGRADGSLHADVTTKDIVVCGTLLATPLPEGLRHAVQHHLELFVRGIRVTPRG